MATNGMGGGQALSIRGETIEEFTSRLKMDTARAKQLIALVKSEPKLWLTPESNDFTSENIETWQSIGKRMTPPMPGTVTHLSQLNSRLLHLSLRVEMIL